MGAFFFALVGKSVVSIVETMAMSQQLTCRDHQFFCRLSHLKSGYLRIQAKTLFLLIKMKYRHFS